MMAFGALAELALAEAPEGTPSVTLYGINYEFSQPVRVPPRLAVALNTPFFYQPATPGIQIGWLVPLSEPRRFPQRLREALQPYDAARPNNAPFFNASWIQPFSDPKRFPAALPVPDQSTYTAEPQPEDQDFLGWYQPLTEPKRFAPRLDPANNPTAVRSSAPFYSVKVKAYVIC